MKQIFVLTLLLIAVSGCAQPTSAPQQTTNTNTVANKQTAATQTATISEADVIARENQVWDALKRKDFDTFASFLAEDQMEVEPTGVYDRAGTLNAVKQVDFANSSLGDFKVLKLNNDAVVVTYSIKGPAPVFSAEGERASTVWVNRNGKWLAVFHQGTPVAKSPAK